MKIKKYNKLVCNVYDKNNFVMHISNLRQALHHDQNIYQMKSGKYFLLFQSK